MEREPPEARGRRLYIAVAQLGRVRGSEELCPHRGRSSRGKLGGWPARNLRRRWAELRLVWVVTGDEQSGWQCSGWCFGERAGPA